MPFSEKVKLEVKEKSAFKCCICENFLGVEIHHIIPESEEGSSDIDNAAPLCPNCHNALGNDPKKRKDIKQRRDWWYKTVGTKYKQNKEVINKLGNISTKLDSISNDHTNEQETLRKGIVNDMYHLLLENEILNIDKEKFKQAIGATITASTSVTFIKK